MSYVVDQLNTTFADYTFENGGRLFPWVSFEVGQLDLSWIKFDSMLTKTYMAWKHTQFGKFIGCQIESQEAKLTAMGVDPKRALELAFLTYASDGVSEYSSPLVTGYLAQHKALYSYTLEKLRCLGQSAYKAAINWLGLTTNRVTSILFGGGLKRAHSDTKLAEMARRVELPKPNYELNSGVFNAAVKSSIGKHQDTLDRLGVTPQFVIDQLKWPKGRRSFEIPGCLKFVVDDLIESEGWTGAYDLGLISVDPDPTFDTIQGLIKYLDSDL